MITENSFNEMRLLVEDKKVEQHGVIKGYIEITISKTLHPGQVWLILKTKEMMNLEEEQEKHWIKGSNLSII